MDEFLRLAYERRERLRRELASVENLIAEHERLNAGSREAVRDNYELLLKPRKPTRRKRPSAAQLEAMFNAAEKTILQAGRPLSRGEIVQRLESEGFIFQGSDKVKVFGTNLWRSRRFVSLKGLGYWPEAHPLPDNFHNVEKRSSMLK